MHLWQSTIYKFVRFPRVCASERVSVNVESTLLSRCDIRLPTIIEEIDVDLLENIVVSTDDTVSMVRYRNMFGVLSVHLSRNINT